MASSSPIKRHGGKAYLAKQIVELMPPHTRYIEPFFGSGAVLFARDGENVAEFVNDLDTELTNFWRILQHELQFHKFSRLVQSIPVSTVEFEAAGEKLEQLAGMFADSRIPAGIECIKRAAWFFIRNRQSRQALGKSFVTPTRRLRRGMNEQVSAWLSAVDGLPEFHARLRRVEIRCMDATDFIRELDSEETFIYADPPYCHGTRSVPDAYMHEMTDDQHRELLRTLAGIKGKFILSGYPNEIYDSVAREQNWRIVDIEIDNKSSGAKVKEKKIERLWLNY